MTLLSRPLQTGMVEHGLTEVDSVNLLSCVKPLIITREAAASWAAKGSGDVPESFSSAARKWASTEGDEVVITDEFTWEGEFSGLRYSDTLAAFAADTTGDASYLLTWEGGDSHTGLHIVDGKAYEHEIVSVIGDMVAELVVRQRRPRRTPPSQM